KGSILKKGNKNLVYTLIATGILLLFSALFNYINLSVALAGKRAKEMAIRSTLGETRRKVAWRFVSEALIFVATCMALALVLAKILEPVFNRIVAGDINLDLSYSVPYLASYALLAALVGLISGLIPAWMSLRIDPVAVIKGEQRYQTKTVFSKIFIIIQNVLTVGLIALALVMELQFKHMVNMPLGADVSGLYYMSSGTIGDDELASKPYIDRIGKTNGYPGERNIMMSTTLGENNTIDIGIINCDPEAFDMFGFEIVRDYHRPRMGTVWFSESAVRAYSIDEDEPVVPDMLKSHYLIEDHEIGGIVKDFAVEGPSKVTGAQIGILSIDDTQGQSCRVLKLNRLDSKVRAELKEIGRQESIRLTGDESRADNYGPINELIERGMSKERNFIKLIELFMLLAAIISLLGLVAMSAYYAGIQTKDIAVRKVFGGTVASETRKAVTEYLILVGVAILIGVPIAIFLAERYLQQFWYKIEGYGWVFIVAALIAILISFLAVLWQTLRAARTNPATELKKE
ncbi:MAG: FtsX-like permease family protein, partial [Bacteroidales bacterium]|nr:FtsX-like permease family protein [Bacteroidales bacterium]